MNNNSKNKKNDRQNLYVTVIVILMMVSVIIAIATSLARNPGVAEKSAEDVNQEESIHISEDTQKHKETEKSLETEDVFLKEDDEKAEETTTAETEKKETETIDTQSTSAKDRLPLFVAPVSGEVLRGCSLEVPVFSQTMEDYRTHNGVDLYCFAGSDVAVVADGIVKKVWDDPMMGMSISVEHAGGAVSVYQNLYDELPEEIGEGVAVRSGQIIATAGNTALLEVAEEDHLHFSLSINGSAVDPTEYIEFSDSPSHEE